MKFILAILIVIALVSCSGNRSDTTVTTLSLLDEMACLDRLANLPGENYSNIQFSSYDRRSISKADSCWFSNEDGFGSEPVPGFEKVLKQPDDNGTGEYLICDVARPGAILRLWTAGLNGKIRLFLDNTDIPFYEGAAQEFFWKTVEKLSGKDFKPEYAGIFRQFDATYFPIPFSRRCRIEWIGDISGIHFYHVGLRIYDQDVKVETFSINDFKDYSEKIEDVNSLLNDPADDAPDIPEVVISEAIIPDSAKKEIFYNRGSRAVEYFSLRISAADMESALRKSVLTIFFDDSSIPQVEAPVGDFFGAAPGLNPYLSLPFSVQSDGTMICRFVMPYKKSVRILVRNWSGENIKLNGSVRVADRNWDEGKTMHFRARWRIDHGMTASTFESGDYGVQDIIYLMASGEGRVVGAGAFIYNPSNATTSWGNWWGEGDEKIFVDKDTFPSFFGTGSEDYFNYSWSSPKIFSFPYCGQPRNDGPGNRGYVSNYRWHISDDILFRDKIAFYMELGHHGIVPGFSYGRIVYFYALPGALDDYKRIAVSDIRYLPYREWEPVAYLGSADFSYTQAEKLIHENASVRKTDGKLWADGSIMTWKPGKKGEKLKFTISSDSAVEKTVIGLTLAHSPEGGTISTAINGRRVAFDGNENMSLFEPFQTILANHFSEPVALKRVINEVVFESLDTLNGKNISIDFIWMKKH